MDTLLAQKGLAIKSSDGRFGVFVESRAVDWFGSFNEASRLFEDLHMSREASNDKTIGTVKFCPTEMGNGTLVVVVAEVRDGYLVQRVGSDSAERFMVTADLLSEPPTPVS